MDRERDRTLVRDTHHRFRERLVTEVLLNRRRRYALYYVYEQSEPVALGDLAVQVAAWEQATTPRKVTDTHRQSVEASLRKTHVPSLEASSLVAYDPTSDQLVSQVDDPDVELYLENDPRTKLPWYKAYLALTAIATVMLGLVLLGVLPFGGVRPMVAAGFIVALFAVASLGHWYDVYRWRRQNETEPPDFLLAVEEDVSYDEESEPPENEEPPE